MSEKIERKENLKEQNSGQMTIEYAVMFVVIVAVVIWAANGPIKGALNAFFSNTATIINRTANQVANSL